MAARLHGDGNINPQVNRPEFGCCSDLTEGNNAMNDQSRYIHFVSRVTIASLFFCAFIGKATAYGLMVNLSTQAGIPLAVYLMPVVMALELGGGLLLLLNRYVWAVSLALCAYLIIVTPFFHFDWSEAAGGFRQVVDVFKNLAIIGGLLALYNMDASRPGFLKRARL
jgi:putative oxidoreductase